MKKNLKTYFSPLGKSLVAQPFTKPGCLENHKTTSKTNIRRTLNSAYEIGPNFFISAFSTLYAAFSLALLSVPQPQLFLKL